MGILLCAWEGEIKEGAGLGRADSRRSVLETVEVLDAEVTATIDG